MKHLQVTPTIYSVFRVLLGGFLFVHFAHLLPYGPEVFSNGGMMPEAGLSPLFGIVPNILSLSDSPIAVQAFIGSGVLASVCLLIGWKDRYAAVWIWYVLACLFARNPLIANPSLPLVGWMALAHAFVPSTPVGRIGTWRAPDPTGWQLPKAIWISAWVVLALSYSYSGYTKLLSPSWVAGDNVAIVLNNPLARDYFLREWFLAMPDWSLKALTWSILWIELLFAPLALFRRLRPWLWSIMLLVQFGFLFLLNFPDLTFPMLLIHLLTFDPNWISPKHVMRKDRIFYDGDCALCHGVVRRVMAEDQLSGFTFSPLDSAYCQSQLAEVPAEDIPDSFIVQTSENELLFKSDAALYTLARFGGLWTGLSYILRPIPRYLRDAAYDFVGRHRKTWFGTTQTACPIVPSHLKLRFQES